MSCVRPLPDPYYCLGAGVRSAWGDEGLRIDEGHIFLPWCFLASHRERVGDKDLEAYVGLGMWYWL